MKVPRSERYVMIRADGSSSIGLAHIFRGIAFAEELRRRKIKSLFVITDFEQKVEDLIRSYGHEVFLIPKDSAIEKQILLSTKIAKDYAVKFILVDLSHHYSLSKKDEFCKYIQGLKATGKYIAVIDGFLKDCISATINLPADMVIIPYYGAEGIDYCKNPKTKYLLGLKYFIFRSEFAEALGYKRPSEEGKNILITFGGADPLNLTVKVAKMLLSKDSLNLHFIIGPAFSPETERILNEMLNRYRRSFCLIKTNKDMAKKMDWADIIITSGGLTKYEAAFLGKPAITICQTIEEAASTESFAQSGTIINLGLGTDVNEEKLSNALDRMLDDKALRLKMSKRATMLMDGKGIQRIVAELSREGLL